MSKYVAECAEFAGRPNRSLTDHVLVGKKSAMSELYIDSSALKVYGIGQFP
jgi:hypothetical protein